MSDDSSPARNTRGQTELRRKAAVKQAEMERNNDVHGICPRSEEETANAGEPRDITDEERESDNEASHEDSSDIELDANNPVNVIHKHIGKRRQNEDQQKTNDVEGDVNTVKQPKDKRNEHRYIKRSPAADIDTGIDTSPRESNIYPDITKLKSESFLKDEGTRKRQSHNTEIKKEKQFTDVNIPDSTKVLKKVCESNDTPSFEYSYLKIVLIVVVLCFCLGLLWYISRQLDDSSTVRPDRKLSYHESMAADLNNKFQQLQQQFPEQSPRFWNVARAPLRTVTINLIPDQPAIIMLAAPPGAHNTVDNIAREIANSYPLSEQPAIDVSGSQFDENTPGRAKEELDELLEDALGGKSKSIVIFNLEKVPPDALLIFYKYCHHETAQYKSAVIVFTVHMPISFDSETSVHEQEMQVEDYLKSLWIGRGLDQEIDADKIGAIVSCIANSIAIAT